MKKLRLIALLLAAVMMLASCGGSKPAETTSPQTSATTEASTEATTEATTAPEIKAEEWVIITSFSEVNANYWNATSYLADAIDAITGKYPELVADISYKEDKYGENVGIIYLGNTKFDPSAELKALGLGMVGCAYKVNSPLVIAICSATDYGTVKAVKQFCSDVLGYDGETVPESMELTVGAQYLYDGDYEIDLTDYELVFEDEFEGTELDLEKWRYRGTGKQRAGYCTPSQVRVEDGNVVIKYEYLEDGEYGPGWYSGQIAVLEWYTRGYFEARMICNEQRPADDFWSAFWLQGEHPYDELSMGGTQSAEIDIVEAFKKDGVMQMSSTVHCAGYAEGGIFAGLRSSPTNYVPVEDMSTAYHTYGLEWTEDEYRFFLDGKCVYELAWADGVSQGINEVILTLCVPGMILVDTDVSGEMIVDYVRIYQK